MKKRNALLAVFVLFVTLLFVRGDYSYAQTAKTTNDDPGYWKAHGYYQEESSIGEHSMSKFDIEDEDIESTEDTEDTESTEDVEDTESTEDVEEEDDGIEEKFGVDVSKWNGEIDWEKAKEEGVEFAIIRVGYRGYAEGTLDEDPYYKQNIEGALEAGIPVGVYMFSQAITEKEAIAEANYILKRICDYKITLPVVMDYEYTGSNGSDGRLYQANLSVKKATAICKAFLKTVKEAGYTPMLYANKYMLSSKLDAEAIEKDYKIWLAHYTEETDYEGEYDFWQYTSLGDGYKYGMQSQNLDLNYWYDDGSIRGRVYRIKYELNGGKNNSKNPLTYRNSKVELKDPTRKGYVFRGWYTDKNFTKQITEIKKGTKKDYKLYAKWEVEVKPTEVKINKDSIEVVKGKKKTLKATVSPDNVTTEGVTWTSSDEKVATIDANGKVTAVGYGTATITAAANGDKNITDTCKVTVPYTIKYVLDEGENSSENPSTYYKKEVVLKDPVREGYIFKGWYTDKEFTKQITKIKKSAKKDYTLYAKWQEIISVEETDITLSKTSYSYNGKTKKPEVTLVFGDKTLILGTDYEVSYKNNKNIGKATVTITGKGEYDGIVKKTFTIKVEKGKTFTSGKYKYKVTGTSSVAFNGIKSTKTTKVEIPKTVKYGGKTFKVTSVANNALKKKDKVTTVVVGSNVKTIGVSAFEGCKKLNKVTLNSALTKIEDKAFKNCTSLKSITIPKKVSKIDKQAFYGCKKLKTITVKSTKLKTVGTDVFKKINSNATIKVTSKKYKSYKKLLNDKGQGSKVKITKIK